MVGLVVGLAEEVSIGTPDPRSIVRDDLVFGIAAGIAAGIVVGLAFGLLNGLAFGFCTGLRSGSRPGSRSGPAVRVTLRCCCVPVGGATTRCPGGWGGSSTSATGPGWCGLPATATSSVTESCRTTWHVTRHLIGLRDNHPFVRVTARGSDCCLCAGKITRVRPTVL